MANLYPLIGDIAIEAFTCLLVFKNLFSFVLSREGIDWLVEIDGGIERLFIYVGSVQVGICLLTAILCKLAFSSLTALPYVWFGSGAWSWLFIHTVPWIFFETRENAFA